MDKNRHEKKNVLSFALASLCLLIPTFYYPLISINKLGLKEEANLIETILRLSESHIIIGFIVAFTVVIAPLLLIFSAIFFVFQKKPLEPCHPIYKIYFFCKKWSMLDVMAIAVLASVIKLAELVESTIMIGTLFCFISSMLLKLMHKNLWFKEEHCNYNNSKTFAFCIAAIFLLIPSNLLPIMTMIKPGGISTTNLWGSIMHLFEGATWPIGIFVFLASFCGPWFKVASLIFLASNNESPKHQGLKKSLYTFIEMIGRWSMIDIFIASILVAIVKLNNLASVSLEEGSLIFTLMVIMTLLASNNFTFKENSHERN